MKIRRATVEDADGIALARVRGWQHGYRGIMPQVFLDNLATEASPRLRNRLENPAPNTENYVAETADGVIVGWANVGPYRTIEDPAQLDPGEGGELYALYLHTEYWGRGIAAELLDVGLTYLRQIQLLPYRLWVLRDNERARRFYEKHGFTFDKTEASFSMPDGTELPEVRYTRA
ncbi:GNAT family N-acetyltransferase [Natronoglycomyces albus]|uniref:GNAT family N-acetyltransferase n=1 Tax=Natronoglycomyces albus TaxID=2811108 RepID=A0A895XNM9_9ACTN|nr:GNAT family N-acetyltransferase [Natronoglycomyces albus]QSB04106.1 GNAT family N-acetyltransferase [Natronoglycomyces albus]